MRVTPVTEADKIKLAERKNETDRKKNGSGGNFGGRGVLMRNRIAGIGRCGL